MRRIGLIGAPGSGKTELAEALQGELGHAEIIDGYIPQIEDEADLVLGFYATYIGNLMAGLGRFAREHKAEIQCAKERIPYLITCGTLIENQLYAAADGANNERYADVLEEHEKRVVVSMQAFGLFMQDLFLYDTLFYLPYQGEREGYLKSFDENLPLAIEVWDIKPTTLEGTLDEKVKTAIATLSEISSAEASS